MKKISLIFSFLLVAVFSHAQVIMDKNATERKVEAFTGIEVSGGFDVYISQSDSYALAVSAATVELRNEIETKVVNGILKISFNTQNKILQKFNQKDLKVFLSAPHIKIIKAGGATDINITDSLSGEDIQVNLSGASDFKGKVNFARMDFNISGASDVSINGNVNKLDLNASGASDFKGKGLLAVKCTLVASGASNIEVNVAELLEPKATGASHIKYYGSPKLQDASASGASKISKGSL